MARNSLHYAAGVAVAFACSARPATAFYFDGWPGAGVIPIVSLSAPGATSVTVGTGTVEIGRVEKPVGRVTPPPDVPEPLSLTLAGCGLAAVGAWRWRKTTRPGWTAGG